jgi:phage tail-like protein
VLIMATRPFALVRTTDQWLRSAFADVALDRREGVIGLAWTDPVPREAAPTAEGAATMPAGGLAFDADCRLYHAVSATGRVERVLWALLDARAEYDMPADVVNVVADPTPPVHGDFSAPAGSSHPLRAPRGLAVDAEDRLFVAESLAGRVLVYDLASARLVRRIVLQPAQPVDVATDGTTVYALLASPPPVRLVRVTARGRVHSVVLPPVAGAPERVAISPGGELYLLHLAGTAAAFVLPVARPAEAFPVAFATDIEFLDDTTLVVARRAGDDFLRFGVGAGERTRLLPLRARGYDGLGIARTPDGRIVFWTAHGPRHAVPARVRYLSRGRVTTFRLDSDEYQMQWGRLFIDACIPEGTEVRVRCTTADEVDEDERLLARTPPASVERAEVPRPDLSPPMPPLALLGVGDGAYFPLHRRESGRELAWTQPPPRDPFETYEAPVLAPPGRFLWVTLELHGNTRVTPRVRALRAEYPSHDYLRRVPRTFSRDEVVGDFLRRYLALFDGFLGEVEARSAARDMLLHTGGTPDAILPWLASFVGLAIDERWPASVRRALLAEVIPLFRTRGTLRGLARFLEIYLGVPVLIIEHWRLRGTGGALLGDTSSAFANSVVGVGLRLGATLGSGQAAPLTGTTTSAIATHAHRFSVIVPAVLTAEQTSVVEHILEVHRPAHTVVDLCSVGAGMRVGRGLHVALSSAIGRGSGFKTLRLGSAVLGRGLLGRPTLGMTLGGAPLGGGAGVA